MRLLCFMLLLLLGASLAAQTTRPSTRPSRHPAELYNATGYNIPGSIRATMVYTQGMYANGADRAKDPDPYYLARQARTWPSGVLTILDYEPPSPSDFLSPVQWDTRATPQLVSSNIARFARLARKVHALRPDLKVSFFGATVADDYDYNQGEKTDSRRIRADEVNTAALKPIADQCDFILIPVYHDRRETEAGYRAHTRRKLLLGARWHKKVIAAVCPNPDGSSIPIETFVKDVQWCRKFSDAILVWQWDPTGKDNRWIRPLVDALAHVD